MDEDLRSLERSARDGDRDARMRLARALVRAGDRSGAAAELSALVLADADREALLELDALTRGGVDPTAPWPGGRGDARRRGRSPAVGIERGAIAHRVRLPDLHLGTSLAVDAAGKVWTTDAGAGLEELVSIDLAGNLATPRVHLRGDAPLLLAGWLAAVDRRAHVLNALATAATVRASVAVGSAWVIGDGHVVSIEEGRAGVARIGRSGRTRWPGSGLVGRATLAPGARAVVLRREEEALGLEWRSLPSGEVAARVGLPPALDDAALLASERGDVFLGTSSEVAAVREEGVVWSRPVPSVVQALAGEESEVLVVARGTETGTLPCALDARTGADLWTADEPWDELPKVDARGVIHVRRGDALVAIEARTGRTLASARIGAGAWSFAPAGAGRCYVLVSLEHAAELLVIE